MHRCRRTAPLALLVAAVATLAACGGSSRPAATVGGVEISQGDVVDELEAIRANDTYVEAIEGSGARVLGEEDDAFDSAFVASQLAVRIQYAIVGDEVDDRGLSVDDECRAGARDAVLDRLARFSPDGDAEAVLDGFPEGYQDYLVDREADVLALQGDLIGQPCIAEDVLRSYYDQHPEEFVEACAAHILVDSAEEAADAAAELEGGADFGTVAGERSTDTGSAASGGQLPCVIPGQLVAEFDAALFSQPLGEIGDPVQTSFGFHIIRVDSRETPPFEDVRDAVAQTVADQVQVAFGDWFTDALDTTTVTVDPRYGTWEPQTASITRPATDETPSTSTSSSIPAEG